MSEHSKVCGAALLLALGLALALSAADLNADLLAAAQKGNVAVVHSLLQQGASVDAGGENGVTALMVAAAGGHLEVVRALLAAHADVKRADNKGLSSLHYAAYSGRAEVIAALLKGGADANAKTLSGTTALMLAAHEGHTAAVAALLAGGADANARASEGTTAAMAAATEGRTEALQVLLNGGADANARDSNGRTALMFAAGKGLTATVQALLGAGAEVNAQDKFGYSALSMAATLAASKGFAETIQALLAAGADVHARDEKRGTAFLLAARDGDVPSVRNLLGAGSDINAKDENGRTALMFAAWNGDLDVVRALLEGGADANARDKKAATALMHAATQGHAEVMRALLGAGAQVNAQGSEGATALISASFWGRTAAVEVLLAAGADVSLKDSNGDTALSAAAKGGHRDIVALLEATSAPLAAGTNGSVPTSEKAAGQVGSEKPPAQPPPASEKRQSVTAAAAAGVVFEDITASAGITFRHINGGTPEKYMPETMGSGGLFFDFDNDGWIDIFLMDGGSFVNAELQRQARHVLYKNNGDATFRDVTEAAGIVHSGYGMGACAADFDNDGDEDLYLTNVGPNVLYRNNGDDAFTDVTEKAGVGDPQWSTSCAWGDIDNDGDLDLFVTNYVDFSVSNNKFCGDLVQRVRAYCHPHVYNGLPDTLYRNNGDGTFTDITRPAGIYTTAGKGLGVVFGDYDDDGWLDIYVANDSVPNFLFHNLGKGRFEEVGMLAGVAVNGEGRPEAGMGTDMADMDGDGRLDIFVTNLDLEHNTLYRNLGKGLFADVTSESGHNEASLPYVGFGTAFFDYDNDGDLDVIVADGHILDNASYFRDAATYAQRNLLFRNDGRGKFMEIGTSAGPGLDLVKVSRGLAVGDIDNDGDLDVLISNNNQTADLLRNDGGNQMNSLLVRTVGTKSNRDGVGARLKLTVGGKSQLREVKAGSSYLGENDLRVHFGLGSAPRAERLEIRWPSGQVEVLENLDANQLVTVVEGKGITVRQPLAREPKTR